MPGFKRFLQYLLSIPLAALTLIAMALILLLLAIIWIPLNIINRRLSKGVSDLIKKIPE